MTILKIYNDTEVTEPEATVYLRLKRTGKAIILVTCDENGTETYCGNLLKFFTDGTYVKLAGAEFNGAPFRAR